jgi:type IV fimbrial biogenesis protein FimT
MARPATSRSRRTTGFTLLEAMVTVAIVGVLASLAVPSFGAQIARNRLKAAAERMAADIAEARFEASRAGVPMHVHFEAGTQWCYVVSNAEHCACNPTAQACQLRHVKAADHQGVTLERASDLHFSPTDGTAAAVAQFSLRSSHGDALRVVLTRLGRAKVCAPESKSLGYPAC